MGSLRDPRRLPLGPECQRPPFSKKIQRCRFQGRLSFQNPLIPQIQALQDLLPLTRVLGRMNQVRAPANLKQERGPPSFLEQALS